MSGKFMTLAEAKVLWDAEAKARAAERAAYDATPEGQAEAAERKSFDNMMREADRRYAEEYPPDPFEEGRDACLQGEPREPPNDLAASEAERLWLDGWGSEHDSEEDT